MHQCEQGFFLWKDAGFFRLWSIPLEGLQDYFFSLAKTQPVKKQGLCSLQSFQLPFFFYKMVLLPLTCRNLHMACHDYRPQIIILCWPQTSPYLLEKDLTVGFKSKPFSMLEKSVLIQESFTLKSKLDSFFNIQYLSVKCVIHLLVFDSL